MYGDGVCAVCGARARGLMCGQHWAAVPKPLQRRVYAALDAWDAGTATLADLRAAQDEAVAAAGGTPGSDPL
jgi:hypothetical protein